MNSTTTRLMTLAIAGVVSAGAFAQIQEIPAQAQLVERFPIGGSPTFQSPQVALAYDNKTTFSGSALFNGGTALVSGAYITKMVGDDIKTRIYAYGKEVNQFWFGAANLDTVDFTCRPRVRFYKADGAGGGPGTYIIGYSYSPINFVAGTAQLYYTTLTSPSPLIIPPDGKMWACITFDNASGSTATQANLDKMCSVLFDPPALGSSANLGFVTTSAGSFVQNNPPGSTFSLSDPLKMNQYWAFQTTLDPVTAAGQILFNNYVATTPSSVKFQWYDTSSNLVAEQVEAVDPVGNFTADTPATAGIYQMSMKTGTWLRRTLTVDTTAGNVSGLVFSLVNGDGNNDNDINSDDFDILVANFGGPGPDGDFDGSGSVDSDDFDILVANFGTTGDGP